MTIALDWEDAISGHLMTLQSLNGCTLELPHSEFNKAKDQIGTATVTILINGKPKQGVGKGYDPASARIEAIKNALSVVPDFIFPDTPAV